MSILSISSEIALLPTDDDKRYDTTYKSVGFELGFGRGGVYRGHSHLRFIDLLFSPNGVRLHGDRSGKVNSLVIAPARTYLPNIEIGDFVFLKFCPDNGEVDLPDKVDEELHEQQILSFANQARLTFPWYANSRAECQRVEVVLSNVELTIQIGCSRLLVIGR